MLTLNLNGNLGYSILLKWKQSSMRYDMKKL